MGGDPRDGELGGRQPGSRLGNGSEGQFKAGAGDPQAKGSAEEIVGKASGAMIGHNVDVELAARSQGAQIKNAADVVKAPTGRRARGTRRIVELPAAVAPLARAK